MIYCGREVIHMWQSRVGIKHYSVVYLDLASSPGPFEKSEKRAWYPLFAHVLNFPTFREFRIIPCYLHVL